MWLHVRKFAFLYLKMGDILTQNKREKQWRKDYGNVKKNI